jgi:predicted peptidase
VIFPSLSVHGRVVRVFVPRVRPPDAGWPCVVFMNGVGQNGTDGERHLATGLPPYVRAHADVFPAFCIFPQCKGPWKFVGDDERVVLGALEAVGRRWRIDASRLYLTGLSQGGCSSFDLGAKYPEKWAALAVVCGAGRVADAPRLRELPIWIFHGGKDDIVPPSGHHGFDGESVGGRDMANVLPGARYTEYPGADHRIWDRVYADQEMWRWLLSQRRA